MARLGWKLRAPYFEAYGLLTMSTEKACLLFSFSYTELSSLLDFFSFAECLGTWGIREWEERVDRESEWAEARDCRPILTASALPQGQPRAGNWAQLPLSNPKEVPFPILQRCHKGWPWPSPLHPGVAATSAPSQMHCPVLLGLGANTAFQSSFLASEPPPCIFETL